LISIGPTVVVAGEAVQERWGRCLARMLMRVLVRTFPNATASVMGDTALQKELDDIADGIWPERSANALAGPEVWIGGKGSASPTASLFIGTEGWISRVAHEPLNVKTGNGASALVAASLGSSEVTKLAAGELLPDHGGRWTADDLELLGSFAINTYDPSGLRMGEQSPSGHLGDVLVVSAGALTNALIAALLADESVEAHLHILDHDVLDVSNLNRYLLVGWAPAVQGLAKVQWLESFSSERLLITGEQRAYTSGGSPAPLVVVGADRLAARHAVQRDRHQAVLNGASEVDLIRVSLHRRDSGLACLGCINQGEDGASMDPAPTISSVSALAGGFLAAQLYRTVNDEGEPGSVFDLHPLQPARKGNCNQNARARVAGCSFCESSAA
jgi:hypothetical protein